MTPLVAGPWIGEFGWELMSWQGALRVIAESREVIVCCKRGHSFLYSDFTKRFVEHDLDIVRPDCWGGKAVDQSAYYLLVAELTRLGVLIRPSGLITMDLQKFIRYGMPDRTPENRFDVIMHARAPLNDPKRAWPAEKWEELTELLMDHNVKMASVGTQAYYPKITADLRNIPLNDLMDLFAGAKLAIGPSSGPMHLASLCGTEHIVWTDNKYWSAIKMNNRTRYESAWNPLKTPCIVVDQYGWDPPVAAIASLVLKRLDEWSNKSKS